MGAGAIAIEDGAMSYDGGIRATLALMNRPDPPDSLVCLTDVMALGAMDAIRHELHLKVPEDVAIIGFDDIAEAGHLSYQLTTVRTPLKEYAEYMIELISAKSEPRVIKIPAQMIVRRSTRSV